MADVNFNPIPLLSFEDGAAYVTTLLGERVKIGNVTSFDPLTIEVKLDASEFDLSGDIPPLRLDYAQSGLSVLIELINSEADSAGEQS